MILNNVRQHSCFIIQGSYVAYIQGDSLARGPKLLSNAEHRQMQVTGRVQYIAGGRGDPCCFPSLPVCLYKFSSHYLNNIIFIDNSLGPLTRESPYNYLV